MKKSLNITIQPANIRSDVTAIAKYLFETDPYIYPSLISSSTYDEWIAYVRECMQTNNHIFSISHLFVAKYNSKVIGLICIFPCTNDIHFSIPVSLPICQTSSFQNVTKQYFLPLLKEITKYQGYYIVNLCVDNGFSGRGIATKLIKYAKQLYPNQPLFIDVVKDNYPAVHLYKKCGFTLENEYLGFGGDTPITCLHMQFYP